jgi:hypothetical protein
MEPRTAGQAGHGHAHMGRVVEQDRGGVGVLADLLAQGGPSTVHSAGGEADGDLAVVPIPRLPARPSPARSPAGACIAPCCAATTPLPSTSSAEQAAWDELQAALVVGASFSRKVTT